MKKTTLKHVLSVMFLLAIAAFAVTFNMAKPRIMILHSYHSDYVWTRDVDVGIRRISDQWTDYAVYWHYMDTKKHKDTRWREQAGLLAKTAVDHADPDVLIIIDDLAQKLVGSHYVNHPTMQIVFAGVNGSVESYGYNQANNVTGIFEHKQLNAIKETILALETAKKSDKAHPRLRYLIDPSASLKKGLPFFQKFDWSPLDFQGASTIDDFEQWKEAVKNSAESSDYLLVANYRNLKTNSSNDASPSPKTVMSWTEENSPIPVVGVNVFNTEDGAMMSVGVSPYEQGEHAALTAERIIEEGIAAADIPMTDNKHYVVALNDPALKKRGIVIPSIYEAFGRATAHYFE